VTAKDSDSIVVTSIVEQKPGWMEARLVAVGALADRWFSRAAGRASTPYRVAGRRTGYLSM